MEALAMSEWFTHNLMSITIWLAALSTFAVYSVLYAENKFYRFFEHVFIGLASGYGVYTTWSQVLGPKWWDPMVGEGQWYWAFAAVAGSMFYFMYSAKHVWISRIIFGFFMGVAAGGMFREFYEIYFPQIGSSMKPLAGKGMTGWDSLGAVVFYVILFSAMTYFFFSFEHKSKIITNTAKAGRWFLMIGFGAIFGATVMGRMTLLIGRFNYLLNTWVPEVKSNAHYVWFWITAPLAAVALALMLILNSKKRQKPKSNELAE